ncbi:MAG: tRNA (guanosine(46)-N7)-methyltransferase TrmB [Firmicutes bacterium]|nr:tRNA (guanosine(46)-N7)-methyltransferase TrmB [Bacillota bacterium]
MRQRNIKNLEERLAENSSFLIEEPKNMKGRWRKVFAAGETPDAGRDRPVYLEIGCGKGKFILTRAEKNPDACYIAVEGQANVILRAMEKAEAAELSNLRLFIDYVNDLRDYFEEGELDGIYLNFSDPWPKARHDKRRLTYHKRLENYFQVLKPEGFVEFKTDNDGLFEFTLEEIHLAGLEIAEGTRDLHRSDFESRLVTTEYEDKFRAGGKNINYVKIKRKSSL